MLVFHNETSDGMLAICFSTTSERKKPRLVLIKGNTITTLAHFLDDNSVDKFCEALCQFLGAAKFVANTEAQDD